jgi:hypothetical protein
LANWFRGRQKGGYVNRATAIVLAALLLSSCAAMQETPIRSPLKVYEYNSIARKYIDRPTHVAVDGSPGSQRLKVSFEPYDVAKSGDYAMFAVQHADTYSAHIAKFLEWAAKARANGDAFDKKIGDAPILAGLSLEFAFHSGNPTNHYLAITLCSLGSCAMGMDDGRRLYFDESGASDLLALIRKLKAGELPGEDVGAKYN